MKFKACENRLIVLKNKLEEVTSGGIVLPNGRKGEMEISNGVVIDSGPGLFTNSGTQIPNENKIGDTVYYFEHHAVNMELDGLKVVILRDPDIILRIPKEVEDATVLDINT